MSLISRKEFYSDLFYTYVYGRTKSNRPGYHIQGFKSHLKFFKFMFFEFLNITNSRVKKSSSKLITNPNSIGKKWVVSISRNNEEALKFFSEIYSDCFFYNLNKEKTSHKNEGVDIKGQLNIQKEYSYWWLLIYLYFSKGYSANYYSLISLYNGFYESLISFLTEQKPVCVFLANDHYPFTRILIFACKRLNIPTFYFQHGSVNTKFPPLRVSASFLFGQQARDVYQKVENTSFKSYLIGDQRFWTDEHLGFNQSTEISVIGIATNMADDLNQIESLCNYFTQTFPKKEIVVRMHPRDNRVININSSQLKISNSKIEPASDYLKNIDVLIAGDSGILLDSMICNVKTLYFDFSVKNDFFDFYGYVKSGLVEYVANHEEIKKSIDQGRRPGLYYRDKSSYFDESIRQGRTKSDMISYIKEVLLHDFGIS